MLRPEIMECRKGLVSDISFIKKVFLPRCRLISSYCVAKYQRTIRPFCIQPNSHFSSKKEDYLWFINSGNNLLHCSIDKKLRQKNSSLAQQKKLTNRLLLYWENPEATEIEQTFCIQIHIWSCTDGWMIYDSIGNFSETRKWQ